MYRAVAAGAIDACRAGLCQRQQFRAVLRPPRVTNDHERNAASMLTASGRPDRAEGHLRVMLLLAASAPAAPDAQGRSRRPAGPLATTASYRCRLRAAGCPPPPRVGKVTTCTTAGLPLARSPPAMGPGRAWARRWRSGEASIGGKAGGGAGKQWHGVSCGLFALDLNQTSFIRKSKITKSNGDLTS